MLTEILGRMAAGAVRSAYVLLTWVDCMQTPRSTRGSTCFWGAGRILNSGGNGASSAFINLMWMMIGL